MDILWQTTQASIISRYNEIKAEYNIFEIGKVYQYTVLQPWNIYKFTNVHDDIKRNYKTSLNVSCALLIRSVWSSPVTSGESSKNYIYKYANNQV